MFSSIRTDLAGATRLGFTAAKVTKRTSFANFTSLESLSAKVKQFCVILSGIPKLIQIVSPKENYKVRLSSSNGTFLAVVEVKRGNDVEYLLRMVQKDTSQV